MALFTLAQNPAPQPLRELTADAAPVIIERGADYRVVEWLQTVTDETSGETLTVTNRYHEIASGLHYLDAQGQYQETVAEFVPVPEGFVAARGPHQAALSSDIATPGSVTLVTPEGQTLTSNPTLLAYVDRVSGQSVQLAALKSSFGELVAPGTVLFPDAFDGLSASVRAVYRADSFECDIVVHSQLPDPTEFGLDPTTTDLAVYTEFFNTQPTAARAVELPVRGGGPDGADSVAADTYLNFGGMAMERGRAFTVDTGGEAQEVPVRKTWEQVEGRDFLIERTAYLDLQPLLQELPEATVPSPEQKARWQRQRDTAQNSEGGTRNAESPSNAEVGNRNSESTRATALGPSPFRLPPSAFRLQQWPRSTEGRLIALSEGSSPKSIAFRESSSPGVVLDYTIVNSTANMVFDGATTYYVTGPVNLSSSVVFNAGTVIKFAKTGSPSLNVLSGTSLKWFGAPYRPVIFTSLDDNSVGEAMPGSTGAPIGTYATTALNLSGGGLSSGLVLSNLCVRHAASVWPRPSLAPRRP